MQSSRRLVGLIRRYQAHILFNFGVVTIGMGAQRSMRRSFFKGLSILPSRSAKRKKAGLAALRESQVPPLPSVLPRFWAVTCVAVRLQRRRLNQDPIDICISPPTPPKTTPQHNLRKV